MARRGWWWAGVGLGTAAMAAAMVVPTLRLNVELAAARRDGLWTSAAEARRGMGKVPDAENAAALMRDAMEKKDASPTSAERTAIEDVAYGSLDAKERAVARRALTRFEPTLRAWEIASQRPRLDYGRRWEDGYGTPMADLPDVKRAIKRLVARGVVGPRRGESFAAAARLSALTRQEPVLIAQTVGTEMADLTLELSRQNGFAKVVEPLLGPPPDVRRALAMELPMTLESMDRLRDGDPRYPSLGFLDRLRVVGPFGIAARTESVRQWRSLWRDLGAAKGYEAQAKTVDARMPAIDRALGGYSGQLRNLVMASAGRPGDFVRAFDRLERSRAAVRK